MNISEHDFPYYLIKALVYDTIGWANPENLGQDEWDYTLEHLTSFISFTIWQILSKHEDELGEIDYSTIKTMFKKQRKK